MSRAGRLAATLALYVSSGACDVDTTPPYEGAWISADGARLLDVDGGRATLSHVLEDGECRRLLSGSARGGRIDADGVVFDVRVRPGLVELTEPSGLLDGAFVPTTRGAHCFVVVPVPTRLAPNVRPLVPAPIDDGSGAYAVSFSLAEGATSFAVYLIGEGVDAFHGRPTSLHDGAGDELLARAPDAVDCGRGACTVALFKVPGPGVAGAGPYTLRYRTAPEVDARVFLAERGPVSSPVAVRLRVVLGPTDHDVARVTAALARAQDALEAHGLAIVEATLVRSEDPRHRTVPIAFLAARTQSLLALGEPDAINVFVVHALEDEVGAYGVASGITGTVGVVGPWNGVLVSLDAHVVATSTDTERLLAETIVHEVGHLLGLHHTTEASGLIFDPLADTPECDRGTYDGDGDGEVLADECEAVGGDNVMFWTPAVTAPPEIPQDVLSLAQRGVLGHVVIGL